MYMYKHNIILHILIITQKHSPQENQYKELPCLPQSSLFVCFQINFVLLIFFFFLIIIFVIKTPKVCIKYR